MKSLILFSLLLPVLQLAIAQEEITPQKPSSYLYFENSKDSAAYAQVTRTFQKMWKDGNPDMRKVDSLSKEYDLLNKRIKGMRYFYRASEDFTPWDKVKAEGLYQSVKKISFYSLPFAGLPLTELLKCNQVVAIEFVNCSINKIPKELKKLKNLHTILIYDSKEKLKIEKNEKIKSIIVRGGNINSPLHKFTKLEKLDLSGCNLTAIPKKLHKNKNLKKLLLNDNTISLAKVKIKPTNKIEKLELQRNQLTEVTANIAKFPKLKNLTFNGNEITKISPAISQLSNLTELSFYKNSLTTLPNAIYELAALKEIDLYYNQLVQLDDRISNLKNLEVLYLSNNAILKLPESLVTLPKLEELYLSNNRLSDLPTGITTMDKLRVLRVNNNYIIQAPNDLLKLTRLENLDISSNQISELPEGLITLTSLKLLVLVNNPWDEASLIKLVAVTQHFREKGVIVQSEDNQ